MDANVSTIDRIIRIIVGAVFLGLYFTKVVTGGPGFVFIILGGVLILTGLVAYCPIYTLFKMLIARSKQNEK
jgi:hypothetical protein